MEGRSKEEADAHYKVQHPTTSVASRFPKEVGEHADSPMRKRPRLDGGVEVEGEKPPQSAKVSTIASIDSADGGTEPAPDAETAERRGSVSLSHTPSKVTLNLRTPDTSPLTWSLNHQPACDRTSSISSGSRMSSPCSDTLVVIAQSSRSNSGEVVEIQIDDPEDIHLGDPELIDDNQSILLGTGMSILDTFPQPQNFRELPRDRAQAWADHIAQGIRLSCVLHNENPAHVRPEGFDLEDLEPLSAWIESEWLHFAHRTSLETRWALYHQNQEFWTALASISSKLLSRRPPASPRSFASFESTSIRKLCSFFEAYIRLGCDAVIVDNHILHISGNAAVLSDVVSNKHLKNLNHILRPWPLAPLWKLITDVYHLDIESVQREWVHGLLRDDPPWFNTLLSFTQSLLSDIDLVSKFSHEVDWSMGVTCYITRHMSKYNDEQNIDGIPIDVSHLDNIQQLLKVADSFLHQRHSKECSNLSNDLFSRLMDNFGNLLHSMALLDRERVLPFIEADFGKVDDDLSDDLPQLAMMSVHLKLGWRFLTKGRMELRIIGIDQLATKLVNVWAYSNTRYTMGNSPLNRIISRWMTDIKMVEYISGAESHPQLIMRSENVIGFLLVTQAWRDELTTAVWSAVADNPDPRVSAAMWKILAAISAHMEPYVLSTFCRKVTELTTTQYSQEMLLFLDKLGDNIGRYLTRSIRTYSTDGRYQDPLAAYIALVCKSADQGEADIDKTLLAAVHQLSLETLQNLSVAANDALLRRKTYAMCIRTIGLCNNASLGCLESVWSLAHRHGTAEIQAVLSDTKFFQTVAQEICLFVDKSRHGAPSSLAPPGLRSRLEIFVDLAVHPSCPALSAELEKDLWSHLVGEQACNHDSRDLAWSLLSKLCEMSRKRNSLVERWTNELVPHLPPPLFTQGLLDFLVQSMNASQRLSPPGTPPEKQVVAIPFADAFWRIILHAPEGSIENAATRYLSNLYLEDRFYLGPLSVHATHTALVDLCVGKLETLAEIVGGSPPPYHSVRDQQIDDDWISIPKNKHDSQLQFIRILKFLGAFIHEIKQRPAFKELTKASQSPRPSPAPENRESCVQICYQVFGHGAQNDGIRHLTMRLPATLIELHNALRSLTGFNQISLIHQGARVAMGQRHNESVEAFSGKGLLLVRNDDPKALIDPTIRTEGISAAERAVLAHHDRFYQFLDLEPPLAEEVYHFLLQFPPHSRVLNLVLQEDTRWDVLFPLLNQVKTLYSLTSMQMELAMQLKLAPLNESFILRGARLLSQALTTSQLVFPGSGGTASAVLLNSFVACLLNFSRERPVERSLDGYLADGIASTLVSVLEQGLTKYSRHVDYNLLYACLLELSLNSKAAWKAFESSLHLQELHRWLLLDREPCQQREQLQTIIVNVCYHVSSPAGIVPTELAAFYWKVLSPSIASLTNLASRCKEFLATADSIYAYQTLTSISEATQREFLTAWTTILKQYQHLESPGHQTADPLVNGIVGLLLQCVGSLKALKKPIADHELFRLLIEKYLFPPLSIEDDFNCTAVLNDVPILNEETRKNMYRLVSILCEDVNDYDEIVLRLASLADTEARLTPTPWQQDRSRWIRPAVGFSGLRNLTNTCYMNSLVAQLYMNSSFRAFILEKVPRGGNQADLLRETQNLFSRMQSSHERSADTAAFARAIRPYDTDHIDVSVQMDVDEFYNLLFDRWERQMAAPELMRQFRAFYGGQSVMQIKSYDCEHVSERMEPFFAIQCEVKGKTGLPESLKAYVEGDVMEGDNKYKCESCGGKFVNAVKRSCLKELPDNLIFHLKRFDFDLTTFQRSKINDEFAFPRTIDMRPYTVAFINDATSTRDPDEYDLVGILVHSGTAETGHYYSYIRLPGASTSSSASWAEFNDAEVSEFDPSHIPDQCFGGETKSAGFTIPKSWNAYMLFYRRMERAAEEASNDSPQSQTSQMSHPLPEDLADDIALENQQLVRRYCLFDRSHAAFVKTMLKDLRIKTGGSCSANHELEQRVIHMVLQHLTLVFSHIKDMSDFESTVVTLTATVSGCSECCGIVLNWIYENGESSEEMLLACPESIGRLSWGNLIRDMLQEVRKLDPSAYGLEADDEEGDDQSEIIPLRHSSSLSKIVQLLKDMLPRLGRYIRAWDEYFGLWNSIASLGVQEIAALLFNDIYREILEIVIYTDQNVTRKPRRGSRYSELCDLLNRNRRSIPPIGLVRVLHTLLLSIDPVLPYSANQYDRLQRFDDASQRFPMTRAESALFFEAQGNPPVQLNWLVGVIDLWDATETEPYWPAEIVEHMMCGLHNISDDGSLGADEDVIARLSETLIGSISDYELAFARPTLRIAARFCLLAPLAYRIAVIEAVARKSSDLRKSSGIPKANGPNMIADYEHRGGQFIVEFFLTLVETKPTLCKGKYEWPFPEPILATVHLWAPSLLLFGARPTRDATAQFLSRAIFEQYPVATVEDGAEDDSMGPLAGLTTLDMARVKAVRSLFEQSFKHLNQAAQLQLHQGIVGHTCDILSQCASWCHKLLTEETGPLAAVWRDAELSIVRRYEDIQPQLMAWGYEFDADEAATDTEWNSEVDDSDAMTEV